jgi:Ca2+-transporting ATPase
MAETTAWQTSETGLSPAQVQERLQIHGPNQIRRKQQDGVLRLLWRQINNSLI